MHTASSRWALLQQHTNHPHNKLQEAQLLQSNRTTRYLRHVPAMFHEIWELKGLNQQK